MGCKTFKIISTDIQTCSHHYYAPLPYCTTRHPLTSHPSVAATVSSRVVIRVQTDRIAGLGKMCCRNLQHGDTINPHHMKNATNITNYWLVAISCRLASGLVNGNTLTPKAMIDLSICYITTFKNSRLCNLDWNDMIYMMNNDSP